MSAPAIVPAAEVEQARQALRDDVEAITTVQVRTIEFDDGSKRTFTAPAPLTLVEQEVHASGAPVGSFTPRSKPPAGIDALTLLAAIDGATLRPAHEDRASWVWSWSQPMASSAPGIVVDTAKTVGAWRSAVESLLDPLPRFQLRGQACPSCGADKVWDRHDEGTGENHARPALEVDRHRGAAVCLCCSEQWPPEMWEHLRGVLEQQQRETLAVQSETVPEDEVRGEIDPAVVQCRGRLPHPIDEGRDRRCPALLDVHGECYLAHRHVDVA